MSRLLLSATAVSLLIGGLHAQGKQFVVPVGFGYDKKPGENAQSTPFSNTHSRNQTIYSSKSLGFTAGTIIELAYRRSTSTRSFAANAEKFTAKLGYSKQTPDNMSHVFSDVPSGKMTTVFSGTLNLPSAPAGTAPHPWSVAVKLSTPFVYVAPMGNLVVDLESESSSSNAWQRDARYVRYDATLATYRNLGNGCNTSANRLMYNYPRTITAVPGKTMFNYMYGAPLTLKFAVNFLGAMNTSPFPIDLTPLGAAGCKLYTSVDVLQVVPLSNPATTYNRALAGWPIPGNPKLVGAKINSQWFILDPQANNLGIALSRGNEITLGTPGKRSYAAQTNWWYGKQHRFASQSSYEYAAITRITLK